MTTERLKYVHSFRDRHGHQRYYFRRGSRCGTLNGEPGSKEFLACYHRYIAGEEPDASGGSASLGERLLTAPMIIKSASLWTGTCCGIYFLIRNGTVVYVGRSRNVYIRMPRHGAKEFDSWHWIPCEEANLEASERAYIRLLDPELNRDHLTLEDRAIKLAKARRYHRVEGNPNHQEATLG